MIHKLKTFLFHNTDTKQTIAKNMFWLSFSQIASRLIRAFIIIYAARLLGAAEYGVFSYALGLAAFFTVFADIGILNIITREIAQHHEQKYLYFASAFWIKVILLIFTTFLILFLAPFFSTLEAAKPLIPLIALLTIFDNIREFAIAVFRAHEKMQWEAFMVIITNVAIAFFGFIILFHTPSAFALTLSYIVSTGITACFVFFLLRDYFVRVVTAFRRILVKPLIVAALPIAFSSIFSVFMVNIDIVMLGWLMTAADVGFYSASQKIIQVLYTLPVIVASSTFPSIARLIGDHTPEKIPIIVERAAVLVAFMALPLTVGGFVLASSIISFLFGAAYLPSVPVLQLLVSTVFFTFMGTLLFNLILAYNEQKVIMWYVVIGSVMNVTLNWFFIRRFGITGAAFATVVVQILYNGLLWRFVQRLHPFSVLPHIKKIIFASLAMGIIVFLLDMLHIPVLITITVSGFFYLFMLHLLREPLIKKMISFLQPLRNR